MTSRDSQMTGLNPISPTRSHYRIIRIPCLFPVTMAQMQKDRRTTSKLWIGSHTLIINTNILILLYKCNWGVPFENGNKRLYPAKTTCELQLCATATITTEAQIAGSFSLIHQTVVGYLGNICLDGPVFRVREC